MLDNLLYPSTLMFLDSQTLENVPKRKKQDLVIKI